MAIRWYFCKVARNRHVSPYVKRRFCVYILSNPRRTVLYIGVTNDLRRRVYEHRTHAVPGFSDRYNVTDILYFEEHATVGEAIAREKQLKAWPRRRKEALIEATNPQRRDLWRLLVEV